MYMYICIYIYSLLTGYTLLELTITLLEFAATCYSLLEVDQAGRIYLSSVSLRYFYCNWASPVINRDLLLQISFIIIFIDCN